MSKDYGRKRWLDVVIKMLLDHGGKTVVEIGSIRQKGNIEGDGYSTVAWAQHLSKVYSVDIDPAATALTIKETQEYGNVIAVTQDGLEFLRNFKEPIDLLYLDAWHPDHPLCRENHRDCYLEAKPNLHSKSLVLIDDTMSSSGKGFLAKPAILADGYTEVFEEWMTLFANKDVVTEGYWAVP